MLVGFIRLRETVIMSMSNWGQPDPLHVTGSDVVDSWERFRARWENYEIDADLCDATTEKRAAVFLACIGSDAYDVNHTLEFETAAYLKKIDIIIEAFRDIL